MQKRFIACERYIWKPLYFFGDKKAMATKRFHNLRLQKCVYADLCVCANKHTEYILLSSLGWPISLVRSLISSIWITAISNYFVLPICDSLLVSNVLH